MSRHTLHDYDTGTFICGNCGMPVAPPEGGTRHRNHCPRCLHSRHVDLRTGDRRSRCGGDMEPIGVWVRDGGECALIHRCAACGLLRSNRIAGDDSELLLFLLAAKPLMSMPFPEGLAVNEAVIRGGRP